MKATIVGCSDAFGTGGRAHTSFLVQSGQAGMLVDFGASSIVSWKKLGLRFELIDGVAISHLHGDHFGGLPFLLIDCQFIERRTRPLLLVGPPGLRQKLDDALDLFFPGLKDRDWSFPWRVEEMAPGDPVKIGGFSVQSFAVVHPAGAISTGLRVGDGAAVFAFSGDTAWTETLLEISADADLFLCECSAGDDPIVFHMDWPTLKSHLARFSAKRIVLTHLGQSAFARRDEMERAGLTIAADGQVFEF